MWSHFDDVGIIVDRILDLSRSDIFSRFFAGIAGYLVVGIVFMKIHFNKDGAEIIPQKNFWFAFPGLIKVILVLVILYTGICDSITSLIPSYAQESQLTK